MESEPNRRPAPRLTHGGDWAGYQEEYGGQPLDFSANVSPLGVPPGVRKAIRQAAASADRYPDPLCRSLSRAIAAHEGVPESFVLCGNGAADLIFRAVLARRPRTALITAPAFSEYETALTACGCEVRRHLLREEQGFRLGDDFPGAIGSEKSSAETAGADSSGFGASGASPDMVFLCEPNNPTGVTSPRELLLETARRCRETGALLVLDECFADFLLDPDAHSLRAFLPEFLNLLILKAFTKLYAMAGVRLGYGVSSTQSGLLPQLEKLVLPFNSNGIARVLAQTALETKFERPEDPFGIQPVIVSKRELLAAIERYNKRYGRNLRAAVTCESTPILMLYVETEDPTFHLQRHLIGEGLLTVSCESYVGLDCRAVRLMLPEREQMPLLLELLEKAVRTLPER